MKVNKLLDERDIDRIIGMAWEDRTPFDAIEAQFGLNEQAVIELMRREMKPSSFKMWRQRVQGRATKHLAKRNFAEGRHDSGRQRHIPNKSPAQIAFSKNQTTPQSPRPGT